MTDVTLDGETSIRLYSSIKEMPVTLYNTAQCYLLQDMGIGSDMQSVDDHFKAFDNLISSGQVEDLLNERNNLRYNFFIMLEKLDFRSMALACYIHSINDMPVDDYSEEHLKELIEYLSGHGLSMQHVEDQLFELKKKISV